MNAKEWRGYELYVYGGRVFSDDDPSTIAGWLQAQIDSEMVLGQPCTEGVIEQWGDPGPDSPQTLEGWNNGRYEPDDYEYRTDDADDEWRRLKSDFRETIVVVPEHWFPGNTERVHELREPQPIGMRLHPKRIAIIEKFPSDQRRYRSFGKHDPGVEPDWLQEKELVPTE